MSAEYPMFALSEEHQAVREAVRAVCEAKVAPHAAEVDESGEFPQAAYDALAASDFAAPHIGEEYGGAGADALATCIVIEEVARACAASSLIPGVNKLGTMPIILAGSDDLKKKYLSPVAAGTAMFSYCLSEPEAGSDAAAMKTRAVRDGDGYVLNGVKRWITNAGVSDYYTVFAVTDPESKQHRISAFVVEKTDEGVSFGAPEKKMGLTGSSTTQVILEDVRVPAERLVGAEGDGMKVALSALDSGRLGIAACAVGLGQAALDEAVRYAGQRQQFGQPIGEFQGLQFLLADMAAAVESARATYLLAARLRDAGRRFSRQASIAKLVATDAAMKVTTDAVQVLGGYGYTRDFPVERYMREAKVTQIFEGTNQIQRLVISRHLLAR